MALSYTNLSSGGATTGFAIDTGDGTKTDVTLTKDYPAGGYQVSSANGNQGLFIFFGASDGTPAGGTSSKSIVATKAFNKVTVIGVTANDLITFTYKETATLNAIGTSSTYSGAVITSFSPNQVSAVNDTITINGAAFGNSVTVKFTGTDNSARNAKSITRVSDTQLIVTRPDIMPGNLDPYKITVQNPGIEPAVSSSTVSNPLYAGAAPVWSTPSSLPAFTKDVGYTQILSASDADGTSVSYSFASGSLPAGLIYATNTSTISGIPTGSSNAVFTIRATESSGRFTDRTFTLPNAYPVFITSSTLTTFTKNVAYSTSITASDDSGVSPSLSAIGVLPDGLSFNALTGLISGTPTATTNQTITIRATDANGGSTDQTFTIPNSGPSWVTGAGNIGTFSKGTAFSTSVQATDDGTITYSLVSGSLPVGLSLNSSTGAITGTPTTSVNSSFTIRATDNNGSFFERIFSLADSGPSWLTASGSLGTAEYGVAFSSQLSVADDDTVSYSLLSGSLPSGLTLSSAGLISGTVPAPSGASGSGGVVSFSVRATDTNSSFVDRSFSINLPIYFGSNAYSGASFTNSNTRLLYANTNYGGGTASYTFTVPVTGNYQITCIGGGGGGDAWTNSAQTDGGQSRFFGNGIDIIANGGAQGKDANTYNQNSTQPGGAGGTTSITGATTVVSLTGGVGADHRDQNNGTSNAWNVPGGSSGTGGGGAGGSGTGLSGTGGTASQEYGGNGGRGIDGNSYYTYSGSGGSAYGGGGGGGHRGSGGGGGGYARATASLTAGQSYTVQIGAGGTGFTMNNGTNSGSGGSSAGGGGGGLVVIRGA